MAGAFPFIVLSDLHYMTDEDRPWLEGLIKDGDTLLCMVPESGRFVVSFMHLTAVSPAAASETQR